MSYEYYEQDEELDLEEEEELEDTFDDTSVFRVSLDQLNRFSCFPWVGYNIMHCNAVN